MPINNIFPIPVGTYQINPPNEKQLKFILNQKQRSNEGNTTSVDSFLLEKKILFSIRDEIQKCLNDFVKTVYAPSLDVNLKITQSWTNYTKPKQWHHRHHHPNSFVSGVYYPKADKEKDRIYFFQPNRSQLVLETENWNLWNSVSWWFPVETGTLVLFPSTLEHMVKETGSDLRVSLALNTFPVGMVGKEDNLTRLEVLNVR